MFKDFAIYRDPLDEIDSFVFDFEGMDQKITPNPIELDRTSIAEVGATLKSYLLFLGVQIK